jgi:hypothetical protein
MPTSLVSDKLTFYLWLSSRHQCLASDCVLSRAWKWSQSVEDKVHGLYIIFAHSATLAETLRFSATIISVLGNTKNTEDDTPYQWILYQAHGLFRIINCDALDRAFSSCDLPISFVYLFVVYLTTLFQKLRLYSVEWRGYEWMMNWKVFGSKGSWPKFKELSCHSSVGTEENHETPQTAYPVSRSRFETGTSRVPGECWISTLKLVHDRFLLNPYKFIIHLPPFHSTLFSICYWKSVVK